MDTIKFHLKGVSPSLMQSDRLANPLDPLKKEMAKITGKRKKTDEDHEEMARIEFVAGIYCDPKVGPFWPGQNIEAMFRDAAKMTRRGTDVKRVLMVLDDKVPLIYEGPRTVKELYADPERFVDMRTVVVQRARTMRCRPIFREWEVKFEVGFEAATFNREEVVAIAKEAGRKIGLSSYRPRFGRFEVVSAE